MLRVLVLAAAAGCAPPYAPADRDPSDTDPGPTDSDTEPDDSADPGGCVEGQRACAEQDHQECRDGAWVTLATCEGDAPVCVPESGCLACQPAERTCDGASVVECDASGAGTVTVEECSACSGGACVDPCTPEALGRSHRGCDFLAVSAANILGPDFDADFGLVVANEAAASRSARVTVSRAGTLFADVAVKPGEVVEIPLPMVLGLEKAETSALVAGGAYEVHSDLPVAVHQANPLGGGGSYTSDWSLLLPEHALTGSYLATTWPTWGRGSWSYSPLMGVYGEWTDFNPGFVAIAATEDGTAVTVTVSGDTEGGVPAALLAGESVTLTLDRGDVLQLFSRRPFGTNTLDFCRDQGWEQKDRGACPPASVTSFCDTWCSATSADLTGSTVLATRPVAVWAGHRCTFVPFDAFSCDHLEEMMLPEQALGARVAMTAPVHPKGSGVAAASYRVLSAADGVTVQFDPVAVSAPRLLDRGEFVEFTSSLDFVVDATGPVIVTQALHGEKETGTRGDPAMGTGIPWRQARSRYELRAPDSFAASYVGVAAPAGATITLDGTAISGFTPIGTSGISVARVAVSPGAHRLASATGEGFVATTYGYGTGSSYLYPLGANLDP